MKKITKITRQKNNEQRYNIFLDEQYAFAVDEAVLVQFEMKKGKILDEFELGDITYEEEIRKAFNKALQFLGFQMRSEHEVKEKLLAQGFGEAVILEAIQKLYHYKFLDDAAYSKALLETKKKTQKKGPRAIAQDMHKKGIDKELQQQVLQQYSEQEQIDVAMQLAEKLVRSETKKTPMQLKQKIQDLLLRKGYSFAIITSVVENIKLERQDDDWDTLIAGQGEKVWRKYAAKYEGYDLRMRTKQALYQKGFPGEVIDAFIEQKEHEEHE
ncbi:MAG: recombination regulator RecX [Caryophanon sp.]|nr:recombination regulator RecX [Caryophanon sp.]